MQSKLVVPIIPIFGVDLNQKSTIKKKKNSAVCVRTRTVNMNTFSTTVKDEISEGW